MGEEGRLLPSLAEERDSRLRCGPESPVGHRGGKGFIQSLKWIQNKRQASSELLSIASLDLLGRGRASGAGGRGRGPLVRQPRGDQGPGALGSSSSDSPRPPDHLLSRGCSGPASPGQDFLVWRECAPNRLHMPASCCSPSAPGAKTRNALFPLGLLSSGPL